MPLEELQCVADLLDAVVAALRSVALVAEHDELRWGAPPLQSSLHLKGFSGRYPGVVGPLDDEQRVLDPVDVGDRREAAEGVAVLAGVAVFGDAQGTAV